METFKVLALSEAAYQTINRALRFAQMKAADSASELVKLGGSAAKNEAWQLHTKYADVADSIERGEYDMPKDLYLPMSEDEDLEASYEFINSLSSTQLDREYLIEDNRVTLREFLQGNLIEPDTDHITIEQAKEVVDLEIGGTTYAGTLVEIKRIS